MDIFDIQPMLESSPEGCGHEPDLRAVIYEYYVAHFAPLKADQLTDEYISAIVEQIKVRGLV